MLRARGEARLLHAVRHGGLRVQIGPERPGTIDAGRIWQDFHASLLGFIARRVRDRDTAEDILQDVMLRIHRHAGDLERPSAVAAWVHQIARNAIADHYRRTALRHEQSAGIELGHDAASETEADGDEARGEIAACLRPLVQELSPIYREAITVTELDGLSQVEAARRLGLSNSGMKSRVQRARAELKDLLGACCEIDLDRRARVTSYRSRGGACGCQAAVQPATLVAQHEQSVWMNARSEGVGSPPSGRRR